MFVCGRRTRKTDALFPALTAYTRAKIPFKGSDHGALWGIKRRFIRSNVRSEVEYKFSANRIDFVANYYKIYTNLHVYTSCLALLNLHTDNSWLWNYSVQAVLANDGKMSSSLFIFKKKKKKRLTELVMYVTRPPSLLNDSLICINTRSSFVANDNVHTWRIKNVSRVFILI